MIMTHLKIRKAIFKVDCIRKSNKTTKINSLNNSQNKELCQNYRKINAAEQFLRTKCKILIRTKCKIFSGETGKTYFI